MEKSIFSQEYTTLLLLLKSARRNANITQIELAHRLKQSQSFVSKYERGERRIDIIQLRTICHMLGVSLPDFIKTLEAELSKLPKANPEKSDEP